MGSWGSGFFDSDSMLDSLNDYMDGDAIAMAEYHIKRFIEEQPDYIDVDEAAEVLVGFLYVLHAFGFEFEGAERLEELPTIPEGYKLGVSKEDLAYCCKHLLDSNVNYLAEAFDPYQSQIVEDFINEVVI